jgi:serine/threonine-protein kinase
MAGKRALTPERAAAVAVQAALGLDYAHRRGIVHRDVKPDNILYDEDGNAVITDFGIATARFHGRLTATGRAMGTPHYMSPEQAMGKLIDGRSDIYALGVVMYEALAGIPPFDGADAFAVGYKHVHEAPVPLEEVDSRIPAPIARVVMRCLVKSPGDRYATGTDLSEALIESIAAMGDKGSAPEALRLATIARLPGRQSGQPVR